MSDCDIRMAVKNTQLKKGSAELLILSLLARRPRHGYELAKPIEARSEGAVRFKAASRYPLLYRLEHGGLLHGRWVDKAGQRRRRHYRATAAGTTATTSCGTRGSSPLRRSGPPSTSWPRPTSWGGPCARS